MKALSLWQPWASLMAVGAKHNETRDWPTRYKGELAICAAKHPFPHEVDFSLSAVILRYWPDCASVAEAFVSSNFSMMGISLWWIKLCSPREGVFSLSRRPRSLRARYRTYQDESVAR